MRLFSASRDKTISPSSPLLPHVGSTGRLAIVACSLVATVVALAVVSLHARSADAALDEAAERTLRDYTGYAGRLLGSELLRQFGVERARILAPVTGSSGRTAGAPRLDEIVRIGEREFGADVPVDSGRGYFRLDLRTGALEALGAMRGPLATSVLDTLRHLREGKGVLPDPNILVVERAGIPYSVGFATLSDADGRSRAIYGFTYTRRVAMSRWAERVFRETPLLPSSFAGMRWNYDTTRVRPREVLNDSLLAMRVTDRAGRLLWASTGAGAARGPEIRARTVISTNAGGLTVETALRPGSEPALIPAVVRRAQRWSMRALLALTVMLAAISLIALRSERAVARARRLEAMQQLALGLRHELNNALASVLLNAELVAEEPGASDDVRERMHVIAEQAERMRGVLRRLEQRERLEVIVPYMDEGFMVDLSSGEVEGLTSEARRDRA
jgi:signal transduction histidine kinase